MDKPIFENYVYDVTSYDSSATQMQVGESVPVDFFEKARAYMEGNKPIGQFTPAGTCVFEMTEEAYKEDLKLQLTEHEVRLVDGNPQKVIVTMHASAPSAPLPPTGGPRKITRQWYPVGDVGQFYGTFSEAPKRLFRTLPTEESPAYRASVVRAELQKATEAEIYNNTDISTLEYALYNNSIAYDLVFRLLAQVDCSTELDARSAVKQILDVMSHYLAQQQIINPEQHCLTTDET